MTTPKRYVTYEVDGELFTSSGQEFTYHVHLNRKIEPLRWISADGWIQTEDGQVRNKKLAEEIHRLIQSRPRSPTVEEITAVLERFT